MNVKQIELDAFTVSYVGTMLWSSTDNSTPQGGDPLDKNYSIADLSVEALAKCKADCEAFQRDNGELIAREDNPHDLAHHGHDFWLTRNGHGAGFWDGDYPDDLGKALTKASKVFGQADPYIGDDGQIYLA